MSNTSNTGSQTPRLSVYQIRVQGRLGREWTERFDGMTIAPQENGDTLLTGPVTDQAALYGLLRTVRDLGLPLIFVRRLPPDEADGPDNSQSSGTESRERR